MNSIKPQRLKKSEIWNKSEEFRNKYVSPINKVPVPIIEIAEIDLKIYPEPYKGLKQLCDIDGFLTSDLKSICIDYDFYFEEKFENRLRFTYAHEIGHLVLHKDQIQQFSFRTPKEWINFRENMSEDDLSWFEYQAYEFAGRLLVPKLKLIGSLEQIRGKIENYKMLTGKDDSDLLREYVSNAICKYFKVSSDVILRRINSERIWEELKL
ncbi:MAG: ImmA/IrrE family metallo-endopeptidase [Promethearchaeota archaeon]